MDFKKLLFSKKGICGICGVVALVLLVVGFGATQSERSGIDQETEEREYEVLLSAEDLLDIADIVPTEFVRYDAREIVSENVRDVYKNPGYLKAYRRDFDRISSGLYSYSFSLLEVTSYQYTDAESAKSTYNSIVTSIINEGGYTEKTIRTDSECFGMKMSLGYSFDETTFYCVNENILFVVNVEDGEFNKWRRLAEDIVKGIDKKFF